MYSDIISEYIVFENCVNIPYYIDRYVRRHCQYIELIPTAPSKNFILVNEIFVVGAR